MLVFELYKNYPSTKGKNDLLISSGSLYEKHKKNVFLISSDDHTNTFTPQQMLSINKNSKTKEEAFEFMVYLAENSQINAVYKENNKINAQIDFLTKNEIFESLNDISKLSYDLSSAIFDAATGYCKGEMDLDALVSLLEQKIEIYSNE